MCELFCFNSKKEKDAGKYLKIFYTHCNMHPHGWGLTNMIQCIKEPIKAKYSTKLENILSNPYIGKNIFAHIRLATVGDIIYENCHPFIKVDKFKRKWVFMHNGTVFDFDELDKYTPRIKGYTDSEKILLYIIDEINKNNASTLKERIRVIEDIIKKLSENNKLNLLIYDGEITYVHTNFKDSLHYLKNNDTIIITTTPLNDNEKWHALELNKLYCINEGEVIYKSKSHGNTFKFTDEHIKYFIKQTKFYFSTTYLKEIPTHDIRKSDFGIEWESLRVTEDGHLALTPHPKIFGDKTINPFVTTDFSESQMELITKTYSTIDEAYNHFKLLFNIVNANLDDGEYLWLNSMPPILPPDKDIPIARYDNDMASEEYRLNLSQKYGYKKQMISGIHYNFSFGNSFLEKLYQMIDDMSFREFKDELYLKISRNYLRYSWLIIYLSGCSTACHETFTEDMKNLCDIYNNGSYYTSKGSSLRNSREGYKNIDELYPNYDNIDSFVGDIEKYIETGKLIEAKELYTQIRLKPKNPKNLLKSLKQDGIQYVEIRTLDLNPYPYDFIKDEMEFLEIFLIYMLVKEEINYPSWQKEALLNERIISEEIFSKNCMLYCNGYKVPFKNYALDLMNEIYEMCKELNIETEIIDVMYDKIINPDLTYAKLLYESFKKEGYIDFNMKLTKINKEISKNTDFSEIESDIKIILPNK